MVNEKFSALVHFVVHRCKSNPERLGAIRLNKALWFIDVISYQMDGQSVSGERYIKRKRGPVPATILATLENLEREGKLVIQESEAPYFPRQFISKSLPDTTLFSEKDLSLARRVVDFVRGKSADVISELTHEQAWKSAIEGEEIPLYATLVDGDRGAITEEVKKWAKEAILT